LMNYSPIHLFFMNQLEAFFLSCTTFLYEISFKDRAPSLPLLFAFYCLLFLESGDKVIFFFIPRKIFFDFFRRKIS
jgi:hypothetical protein